MITTLRPCSKWFSILWAAYCTSFNRIYSYPLFDILGLEQSTAQSWVVWCWTRISHPKMRSWLSYFLNLTGPAMEVKTACSSSAVALHQVCAAIRAGDCTAAIVASATTHFSASASICKAHAGIGSSSGRCRTFMSDADGFLPG